MLRTYLVYNTVVRLCQFFGCGGNSSHNENRSLQKNLIGLLHYDPIANDVRISYDLTLFYSVFFYFVYERPKE